MKLSDINTLKTAVNDKTRKEEEAKKKAQERVQLVATVRERADLFCRLVAWVKEDVLHPVTNKDDDIIGFNFNKYATGLKYSKKIGTHMVVGATSAEQKADEDALRRFQQDYSQYVREVPNWVNAAFRAAKLDGVLFGYPYMDGGFALAGSNIFISLASASDDNPLVTHRGFASIYDFLANCVDMEEAHSASSSPCEDEDEEEEEDEDEEYDEDEDEDETEDEDEAEDEEDVGGSYQADLSEIADAVEEYVGDLEADGVMTHDRAAREMKAFAREVEKMARSRKLL